MQPIVASALGNVSLRPETDREEFGPRALVNGMTSDNISKLREALSARCFNRLNAPRLLKKRKYHKESGMASPSSTALADFKRTFACESSYALSPKASTHFLSQMCQ